MKDVYTFILERGNLSQDHREELRKKRGFTDETIARNRFFSGGKYLTGIEQELISRFSEEKLLASGVVIKVGKSLVISELLLGDRVIIPYLDKDSNPYLLRPHKLGLQDVAIEVYQELNMARHVILTEGEFKAAACVQLGIPAIAIPGISSFCGQHFPKLIALLNRFAVKDLCIVFDNEVKDDPAFPSYKDHPSDRFDVQYYAHLMAEALRKEGFRTQVGLIPDSWRTNGKADLDGALAQGKIKEDIEAIVVNSKTDKEFLAEQPKEAQRVMARKRAKRFFKSHIKKEFGKYVALRKHGKFEDYVDISNFTIKIIATHQTIDGIFREVVFINEFGEATKSFSLSPTEMMGVGEFRSFCVSKGNYIWKGRQEELDSIWEGQFLDDDGRHIIEIDHVGWVEDEKLWLFGNVAITGKGEEMRPDANHVFWTEKRGIKPIPLGGPDLTDEGIPHLCIKPFDQRELLYKLTDTVGETSAKTILGWFGSILFMEEVFDAYQCFPFLFICGKKGCGKSTIATWLTHIFGLEGGGKQAADTTSVGLQRYLSYFSSLPVYIDEYRNTKQVSYKNGFLRNCYNRQSAGKGIKASFGVREAKIRGTLLVTGEETPEDNALLSRCVIVNVSMLNRKTNHFNWFSANRLKFSNISYSLLKRKPEISKRFLDTLEQGKELFVKSGADDRTAINHAIIAAGYQALFDDDLEFGIKVAEMAVEARKESEAEHIVKIFLDDLVALRTRGLLEPGKYAEISDGKLYFYFHGAYMIWAQEYRKARGVESFKQSSIRDYLKEEPGFLDSHFVKKIDGICKRCVVFDAGSAPEEMHSLVGDSYLL